MTRIEDRRRDVPASARRYLIDSERLLFAVRRHVAVLSGTITIYVLVLAAVVLVLVAVDGHGPGAAVAVVGLLGATTWFGWNVGDWWTARFTVTDRRVLLVSGLLTRRVAIMPLRKVTDLTYERSFTGRLLGFGAFVMESAGQHQALSRVDYLPAPDDLYQQMSGLLFGNGRAASDPDEDGDEVVVVTPGGSPGTVRLPRVVPPPGPPGRPRPPRHPSAPRPPEVGPLPGRAWTPRPTPGRTARTRGGSGGADLRDAPWAGADPAGTADTAPIPLLPPGGYAARLPRGRRPDLG